MKKVLYVFVIILFSQKLLADDELTKAIEGLQKYYDSISDFQASFEQHYYSVTLGRTKISSGRLYVKKPGMVRWDYKKPQPKHFLLNGKELTIYDPELEQVMVDKNFSSSDMTTALEFLLGKGKLSNNFEISFSDKPQTDKQQVYKLKLIPKKKSSFSALYLLVSKNNFQVLESIIEDHGGNSNRLVFSKIKTNRGLKDQIFKLAVPPGVEVLPLPKDIDLNP